MADEIEINKLISESIKKNCIDDVSKGLIESLVRYELDIFNRRVSDKEIKEHYNDYIDRAIKGMKD